MPDFQATEDWVVQVGSFGSFVLDGGTVYAFTWYDGIKSFEAGSGAFISDFSSAETDPWKSPVTVLQNHLLIPVFGKGIFVLHKDFSQNDYKQLWFSGDRGKYNAFVEKDEVVCTCWDSKAPHSETVAKVSLDTGNEIWKKKVGPVFCESSVHSQRVFVSRAGTSDPGDYPGNGGVHAFALDGSPLWQAESPPGRMSEVSTGAYSGGQIFVNSDDHRVYAIKASDGGISWQEKVDSQPQTYLVAVGQHVFSATRTVLYAFHRQHGSQQGWKIESLPPIQFMNRIRVWRNYIYFGAGEHVHFVDPSKQQIAHKVKTHIGKAFDCLIEGNRLYVASGIDPGGESECTHLTAYDLV